VRLSAAVPEPAPEVRLDHLDDWPLQDCRNDLELASAVRATLPVDLDHALE
jgi:hypothetical protein